jgi:hypothetical protein
MKVLTLHLPWAWWIRKGWKTIETRLHSRFANTQGRIGIHAGLTVDPSAIHEASPFLTSEQIQETLDQDWELFKGRIIASARVDRTGSVPVEDAAKALIECETPRHGLWLGDVAETMSAPVRGFQGLWTYDGELRL